MARMETKLFRKGRFFMRKFNQCPFVLIRPNINGVAYRITCSDIAVENGDENDITLPF